MTKLTLVAVVALAAVTGLSAQQSSDASPALGDVARQQRSSEPAAPAKKVWTNDDFQEPPAAPPPAAPTAESLDSSDAKHEPTDSKDVTATADVSKSGEAKASKDGKEKKADPVDEQAKVDKEWKSKLDAQKDKIAGLQREYELTDRESKLAATTYYADAGNRLRDQKDFADKEAASRDKLNTLKQQITDEQAKLTELQEQAHKSGANKAYE